MCEFQRSNIRWFLPVSLKVAQRLCIRWRNTAHSRGPGAEVVLRASPQRVNAVEAARRVRSPSTRRRAAGEPGPLAVRGLGLGATEVAMLDAGLGSTVS